MYSDQWTKVVLLVSVRVVIARKSVLWIQLQWSDIISVRWRFSVTSNPNGVQLRIQQEQIVHWYISIIFYPILIPKVTVLLLLFFSINNYSYCRYYSPLVSFFVRLSVWVDPAYQMECQWCYCRILVPSRISTQSTHYFNQETKTAN